MVNPSNYTNSEEQQEALSPLPDSQGSETSCIEVNDDLGQTDEATTREDTMANTQAILDLPLKEAPKKSKPLKTKNKGLGKTTSVLKKRKAIQTMSFFIWLKNYWDNESTVLLMGKFVTAIKRHSLVTQNSNLGRLVRPLNQIMKTFILHMDEQRQNLKKISWDSFESWALNQGLSTMYSNCQTMVWDQDFENILFKIYGQVYLQHQEEKTQEESSEEEEESLLLPNTTITSMSSMTARTRFILAYQSDSTLPDGKQLVKSKNGGHHSKNQTMVASTIAA